MNSRSANSSDATPEHDFFELAGTIDAQSESFFRELPGKVRRSQVRFDFSQTGRINSMGIALLLRCFKEIRQEKQAEILLLGLSPTNSMLFKMTGVFLLATPVAGQAGEAGR
jgi:anti-anti-sigma regulatory factor